MKHLFGQKFPGRHPEYLPEHTVAVGSADAQLCSNIINAVMAVAGQLHLELLKDQSLQTAADLMGKLYLFIRVRSG
ncbi:hypothetical protein D3C75_1015460 [compost metagenome]